MDTSNLFSTLTAIAFLVFVLWCFSRGRKRQEPPATEPQEDSSFDEEIRNSKLELIAEYYKIEGKPRPTPEELLLILKSAEEYSEDDEEDYCCDDDEPYIQKETRHRREYIPPKIEKYWDTIEELPTKGSLEIKYINADEEISARVIHISYYDGSPYLNAFCELRHSDRIFRIDRIKEAIDTETGEIIKSVPDFLLAKYHLSSEYALSLIFSKHLDLVKVIYYIGKADGRLQAAERNILYDTIRSLSKGIDLTDKELEKRLKNLTIPSAQGFKLAFARIFKESPEQAQKVFLISEKIIATHNKHHASEQEALDYMVKKLKS